MMKRAYALDALRGYAILTMVLSATIAGSILPAWMYHAQTPPPDHVFDPNIAGLTWVDLVFPFFLFAMGAAFPFSIGKKYDAGESRLKLSFDAVKRGVKLAFFAIFIQHFYPYALSNPQDIRAWLLAISAFVILFPMFMRIPLKIPFWAHLIIKLGAYLVALLMLFSTNYIDGQSFNLYHSNIIILLLANMAFWGAIIYIYTIHNRILRIGILIFLLGIICGSKVEGWQRFIFDFTPCPWLYKFDYLKYLFIVLPGSIAGEYLLKWMRNQNSDSQIDESQIKAIGVLLVALALIVGNLICLYNRWVVANLGLSVVLLIIGFLLLRKKQGVFCFWRELFVFGGAMLLLGLCLEPSEGGIKKDPATFSYFLVTSGLGCMALIIFHILCDYFSFVKSTRFLVMTGQNPMIAYVAGDLLIMPLLGICGVTPFLFHLHTNVWLGFIQGIILTFLSLSVTLFFTKIRWFWKT